MRRHPIVTRWVDVATAARARPARRPASLQLVGIVRLFSLLVPCWTPRGTHPDDRPTALSRIMHSSLTHWVGPVSVPIGSDPNVFGALPGSPAARLDAAAA